MTPAVTVRNATTAPIRCFVMEGGPITQLVTIQSGAERTERLAPGASLSLSCPKVRGTVFGPLAPGRYVFRVAKGRVELSPEAPPRP
jgi:hypothetical protein